METLADLKGGRSPPARHAQPCHVQRASAPPESCAPCSPDKETSATPDTCCSCGTTFCCSKAPSWSGGSGEVTASWMTGKSPKLMAFTCGCTPAGKAPPGRAPRPAAPTARPGAMSVPYSNKATMMLMPSLEYESSSLSPGMALQGVSTGTVTPRSMSAGEAPGCVAKTVSAGYSMLGMSSCRRRTMANTPEAPGLAMTTSATTDRFRRRHARQPAHPPSLSPMPHPTPAALTAPNRVLLPIPLYTHADGVNIQHHELYME